MVPSLFILASPVWKSFHCLISILTQEGEGGHLFRLTFSPVLWGGRNTANITGVCGEHSQCMDHTGFAPAHGSMAACAFQVYTAQAPGCSAGVLSKMGPAIRALPRSKMLWFRFLGTPQCHRLGWACILCPFQVWAAQATRCFVSSLSQVGHINHLPSPTHSVSWVHRKSTISGVSSVSSEKLISGCDPPGRCQLSRNPERHG